MGNKKLMSRAVLLLSSSVATLRSSFGSLVSHCDTINPEQDNGSLSSTSGPSGYKSIGNKKK